MSSSSSKDDDDTPKTPKKVDSRRPSSSVGDAFGRIWECYCAFLSFFLSLSLFRVSDVLSRGVFSKEKRAFVGVVALGADLFSFASSSSSSIIIIGTTDNKQQQRRDSN